MKHLAALVSFLFSFVGVTVLVSAFIYGLLYTLSDPGSEQAMPRWALLPGLLLGVFAGINGWKAALRGEADE